MGAEESGRVAAEASGPPGGRPARDPVPYIGAGVPGAPHERAAPGRAPPGAGPIARLWARRSGRIVVVAVILLALAFLGYTLYFAIAQGPGFRFGRAGSGRDVPDLGQREDEAVVLFLLTRDPWASRGHTFADNATVEWRDDQALYVGNATVPVGNETWRVVPRTVVLHVTVTIPTEPDDGCRLERTETVFGWRDGDRFDWTLGELRCEGTP